MRIHNTLSEAIDAAARHRGLHYDQDGYLVDSDGYVADTFSMSVIEPEPNVLLFAADFGQTEDMSVLFQGDVEIVREIFEGTFDPSDLEAPVAHSYESIEYFPTL